MELLLPESLSPPLDGTGLIAGVKVQNGKYLVTHFVTIPVDESHENLIGYCVQIVNRLFGGVGLVGCYSTNQNENVKVVQACRSYVSEYQSNQSFVSVLFADGKATSARRHVGMNQTSKSDVKNVPNSKYPLVVLESNVTLSFTLAIDSLDFKTCVELIQERIERQASNLMISINNSFGQSEEAIFKNSKASKKTDYPSTLSSQLYFTADALTEPLNIANTALNFVCNMSVFGVVNSKSTFSEAREILSEDIKRSMACRVEIIEDQVEDCSSEDKENIQNLFSSFELARRVNYDFGVVPISLYEGAAVDFQFRRSQRASDDLADFFQIAESTTLFKYPEPEIVEDDDEESEEEIGDKSTSSMNLQIMAVLVLIIGIILAIFLQEK